MTVIGIPIVSMNHNNQMVLHEDDLRRIITNDAVKDLPVYVFSICGAPQTGKSLIIDLIIRYIHYRYFEMDGDATSITHKDSSITTWINVEDNPLERGSWKSGVTNGILMWPEIFICRKRDDCRIAMLFIETHGAFENTEDDWKWKNMFMLSTLISSVQIYNVLSELKHMHVDLLELFYDFGFQVKDQTKKQPLKKFHFLVRDWTNVKKFRHGSWGGLRLLSKLIREKKVSPNDTPLAKKMTSAYSEVGCYLLPPVGSKVNQDVNPVDLNSINETFLEHVNDFVRMFASPDYLTEKDLCGQQLLTKDLEVFFRVYISEAFKHPAVPSSQTLMIASSTASHDLAKLYATNLYTSKMKEVCSQRYILNPAVLQMNHEQNKVVAMNNFSSTPKVGGEAFTEMCKNHLEVELDELFQVCETTNKIARLKYYYLNRTIITILLMTAMFGTLALSMYAFGNRKHMIYALITTKICLVLLVCELILQYSRSLAF